MPQDSAAHLHGQEILLVRQDAVGVDVFLEPAAAGRASGAGVGWHPPLPARPLPCPVLLQPEPYSTSTHSEQLQYHYYPRHTMSWHGNPRKTHGKMLGWVLGVPE